MGPGQRAGPSRRQAIAGDDPFRVKVTQNLQDAMPFIGLKHRIYGQGADRHPDTLIGSLENSSHIGKGSW